MKPVHCSWVDMQKVRASLSGGKRGDQSTLMQFRCVEKGTVSKWKSVADVLDVLDGKVSISKLSHFQPSHAASLARHLRKLHGKRPESWPADDVENWVQEVEAKELTVEQFETALLKSLIAPHNDEGESEPCCTVDDLKRLADNGEQFGCIYADPPWGYSNQATRASTDNHYPTMTVDEIAALPVGELALDRSHLWLWTTNAFLFECPRLFAAWGFEFKSSYVWCKTQIGIGNYLRNAHEFLLLAVRGGLTGAAKDIRSWGEFPRGEHSAKPERIRVDVVERASPGPRLELFGRKAVQGWTVWGNQIRRGLLDGDVREVV